MQRWQVALVLAGPWLAGKPAGAQTAAVLPPDSITRREILAAEQALERAVVSNDTMALDTLYTSDFESRHWTGETDTKTMWLAFLKDSVQYTRHTATPTTMQIYTHAVWVSGILSSKGRHRTTGDFGYTLRYARLWVSDSAGWKVREQLSRPVATSP